MKTTKKTNGKGNRIDYKQLARILKTQKQNLKERYKISEIGIFGSYVRGEHKRGSDLDILVEYEQMPDLLEFINLERYLEKILKRKVDLVQKCAVRRELQNNIFTEVIYL